MNKIAKIKNEVNLKHWSEMVRQRNESGLILGRMAFMSVTACLSRVTAAAGPLNANEPHLLPVRPALL